jgi:hypothetical protein
MVTYCTRIILTAEEEPFPLPHISVSTAIPFFVVFSRVFVLHIPKCVYYHDRITAVTSSCGGLDIGRLD